MTANILAEVRARHGASHTCVGPAGHIRYPSKSFRCDAARLAALLTPERLAAALDKVDSHAYVTDADNVCVCCGVTGSYGHTGEYRATAILTALTSEEATT